MQVVTDAAFGVIVAYPASPNPDDYQYLLVLHHKGHWGIPKGHKEGDESDREAAIRELAEETGIEGIELLPDVEFQEQYRFKQANGEMVNKTVTYFVAKVDQPIAINKQEAEIADAGWFTFPEAINQLTFDAVRQVLRDCHEAWLTA